MIKWILLLDIFSSLICCSPSKYQALRKDAATMIVMVIKVHCLTGRIEDL